MISLQLVSRYWPFKFSLNSLMTILLKKEAEILWKLYFANIPRVRAKESGNSPALPKMGPAWAA